MRKFFIAASLGAVAGATAAEPATFAIDPGHTIVTAEALHFNTSTQRIRMQAKEGTIVLDRDAKDPAVKTIVAGMHEALPYSKQRGHAMDASCQGLCSGQQAYDLLYRAQKLAGKRVYVFASHSHLFVDKLFETPEHDGQVLPGWVVGTAGAVQYRPESEPTQYGYALVAVQPDGTLDVRFREVTRGSPPLATGPGADRLTEFCFDQNKQATGNSGFQGTCACGQAQP